MKFKIMMAVNIQLCSLENPCNETHIQFVQNSEENHRN